ncbi:hypothetical protein JX265_008860 [Neoarthrinium moseri]|uniref:Oxidation resistance protein 1 n=1 Tax=Neoarthrinium moseri TaxID=1658444 RepID=A0A9P9WHL5_9PEZI|nr:uncharacterized protein JN550_009576 [Neoarthrinium moseri]KAI1848360.1 hypothetical protein JX266_005666 [Neoarthrinium moseri]KAI1863465.1 hypothetical protein JN550_009576 [Neoarthrinium moseri]KAI1863643.1 hypothetical protein JX265_008860 [Neoarthrinium moseri]
MSRASSTQPSTSRHDSGILIPGLEDASSSYPPSNGTSTPVSARASAPVTTAAHRNDYDHDYDHDQEQYGISSMISGWFGRTFGPSSRSNSHLSASMHSSKTFPTDMTSSQHNHSNGDGITAPFSPSHRPLSRTASPFVMPDYEPLVLRGYERDTDPRARLLSTGVAEAIRMNFPERLRICEEWRLVYSLYQNGSSLATLYKLCEDYRGRRVGFVLVVRDGAGGTFGGYLTEAPHIAGGYYGTGECFLWKASVHASLPPPPSAPDAELLTGASTTIASPTQDTFDHHDPDHSIRFQYFPYVPPETKKSPTTDEKPPAPTSDDWGALLPEATRQEWEEFEDRDRFYFINSERSFLALGGGKGRDARYGLWLDDGFNRGQSGRCGTFENDPLSDEGEKFDIIGVELWVVGAT